MDILERLIRYAKVWTTSAEDVDATPTTQRQFDLARILEGELKDLGLESVEADEHCYVYGCLPATLGLEDKPAVGFIAHMDTAEFCGENVKPRVIENYDGKKVTLENGLVLDPKEFGHLRKLKGRTLVVTDGNTLLGADDKAGIAVIMELLERLVAKKTPHGKVCVCFTPDEEVGAGTRCFDITRFGAGFAFTVDGGEEGEINWECFNAAGARVDITGKSIHPGKAKGKMVNASLVAMECNSMLPGSERPELTEGYEGFFGLMHMDGTVDKARLEYIIRDHDAAKFEEKKQTLSHIVKTLNEKYGPGTAAVEFKEQYRNMREALAGSEHLVQNAVKATKKAGVKPQVAPIRGGTDGAMLSFRGLPCPNLGTGGWCFHGPLEHVTQEGMEKAADILENLVEIYA